MSAVHHTLNHIPTYRLKGLRGRCELSLYPGGAKHTFALPSGMSEFCDSACAELTNWHRNW